MRHPSQRSTDCFVQHVKPGSVVVRNVGQTSKAPQNLERAIRLVVMEHVQDE